MWNKKYFKRTKNLKVIKGILKVIFVLFSIQSKRRNLFSPLLIYFPSANIWTTLNNTQKLQAYVNRNLSEECWTPNGQVYIFTDAGGV